MHDFSPIFMFLRIYFEGCTSGRGSLLFSAPLEERRAFHVGKQIPYQEKTKCSKLITFYLSFFRLVLAKLCLFLWSILFPKNDGKCARCSPTKQRAVYCSVTIVRGSRLGSLVRNSLWLEVWGSVSYKKKAQSVNWCENIAICFWKWQKTQANR